MNFDYIEIILHVNASAWLEISTNGDNRIGAAICELDLPTEEWPFVDADTLGMALYLLDQQCRQYMARG